MDRYRRTGRGRRLRAAVAVVLSWTALVGAGLAGADTARGATTLGPLEHTDVAPGVGYDRFRLSTSHGAAYGHLLTVDLRDPRVSVDLLHPDAVGARSPVSRLAAARGAVGAVNGDFFHISESQHPGVEATGAPVGPAVANGRTLKGAVPDGQRFGPAMPPGGSTEDVLGVGSDGVARLDRLVLRGTVRTGRETLPLRGLNQYAVAQDGIGAYTPAWGTRSRLRATCGTDTRRAAPCSKRTYEVTVRRGKVAAVATRPGSGPIAADAVVLVGREAGAGALRGLRVGDPVRVAYRLDSARRSPLDFAVGGFPIARDGRALAGLDAVTTAVRTAAGFGDGGRRLYLLALDGGATYRKGLTVDELARLMLTLGARSAVNLDGGGSTTLVAKRGGSASPAVLNHPSEGAERPIPNGIGVFTRS